MCVSKTLSIRKPQSDSRHTNLMTKFINEILYFNVPKIFNKNFANITRTKQTKIVIEKWKKSDNFYCNYQKILVYNFDYVMPTHAFIVLCKTSMYFIYIRKAILYIFSLR